MNGAHNHENCTARSWPMACNYGALSSTCTDDSCDNEYCSDIGHCDCKCHSGKTCGCGHSWPRMAKKADEWPPATLER